MTNEITALINNRMNLIKIKDILIKTSGLELNKLSEPCYAPQVKKHFYELLKASHINEKDLKNAVKAYWKGTKQQSFYINNDVFSNLLILYMHIFLSVKPDKRGFEGALLFYVIRQYANVFHKYFPKYCDKNVFRYALDNMTKTHLFYTQGSIGGALYYLSQEIIKRTPKYNFKEVLAKYEDKELISKFMQACRHRINQSTKSFVTNAYYPAEEAGKKITQEVEYEEGNKEEQLRTPKIIETIVDSITIYKILDRKIYNLSIKTTKVKESTAKKLIHELMNPKYKDQLLLCYTLFVKELELQPKQICTNEFFKRFKKILSIKKTNKIIY